MEKRQWEIICEINLNTEYLLDDAFLKCLIVSKIWLNAPNPLKKVY